MTKPGPFSNTFVHAFYEPLIFSSHANECSLLHEFHWHQSYKHVHWHQSYKHQSYKQTSMPIKMVREKFTSGNVAFAACRTLSCSRLDVF